MSSRGLEAGEDCGAKVRGVANCKAWCQQVSSFEIYTVRDCAASRACAAEAMVNVTELQHNRECTQSGSSQYVPSEVHANRRRAAFMHMLMLMLMLKAGKHGLQDADMQLPASGVWIDSPRV